VVLNAQALMDEAPDKAIDPIKAAPARSPVKTETDNAN
jgi:hypothetical protein